MSKSMNKVEAIIGLIMSLSFLIVFFFTIPLSDAIFIKTEITGGSISNIEVISAKTAIPNSISWFPSRSFTDIKQFGNYDLKITVYKKDCGKQKECVLDSFEFENIKGDGQFIFTPKTSTNHSWLMVANLTDTETNNSIIKEEIINW